MVQTPILQCEDSTLEETLNLNHFKTTGGSEVVAQEFYRGSIFRRPGGHTIFYTFGITKQIYTQPICN